MQKSDEQLKMKNIGTRHAAPPREVPLAGKSKKLTLNDLTKADLIEIINKYCIAPQEKVIAAYLLANRMQRVLELRRKADTLKTKISGKNRVEKNNNILSHIRRCHRRQEQIIKYCKHLKLTYFPGGLP